MNYQNFGTECQTGGGKTSWSVIATLASRKGEGKADGESRIVVRYFGHGDRTWSLEDYIFLLFQRYFWKLLDLFP